jgi:hypothetical protein
MQSRPLTILLVAAATLLTDAHAHAQNNKLQQQLAKATAVRCTFATVATGTWSDGVASAAVTPAKLTVAFTNVNADEGTADAEGTFGGSLVVVRYAVDYLHLMQTHSAGPLYTTTVLAKATKEGRFLAVHTRHEYTDVRLPGFTSRPEMYVGDCQVGN